MIREDVTKWWRNILATGDIVMHKNRLYEIMDVDCEPDGYRMCEITLINGHSGNTYLVSKTELFLPTFTARPEGEF